MQAVLAFAPLDGGATPGRGAPARAVPLTSPRAGADQ
jgi:hypothetical protein